MALTGGADQDRFDELQRDWRSETSVEDLESRLALLIDEWREVEWRSGGRTLLTALGLQHNEVALCRGLAWLLDPEGGHGMGPHALLAFCRDLEVQVSDGMPISIRVEESRDDSRADIVLRIAGHTIVVEAKVFAGEQIAQADRLSKHWGGGGTTTLVFLTRTGHLPLTATESEGQWVPRTWRDVARLLRNIAASSGVEPSAGAREFIETIGAL